ncbi:MAG: CrcB family protein [Rhodobacteraceae bacterium]|nr:CrcB family protein [Paracoccaceae bacterium]TVR48394.1 MAG: CrcB family protein [Paracoccaceae bacterium]
MAASLNDLLMICLGGGLGSMARASLAARLSTPLSPHGAVFVINASGSFAIGVALGLVLATVSLFDGGTAVPHWFTIFAVGLLGGFTTVSTYALQVLDLWRSGRVWQAGLFGLGSLLVCPLVAALGLWAALALQRLV